MQSALVLHAKERGCALGPVQDFVFFLNHVMLYVCDHADFGSELAVSAHIRVPAYGAKRQSYALLCWLVVSKT